jgi:hypothetical protein
MSYTVGDRGVPLVGVCTDGGTPVNLAGAAVELHVRAPGGRIVGPAAATVTDSAAGRWQYLWATGDLADAGTYQVEAQVTAGGGSTVQTFGPAPIVVHQQIG